MTESVAERALWRNEVARVLVAKAPEVLDRYFEPDCCILATRFGLEVLRYFGIEDAYAQPLRVQVINPEARALLDAGATSEQLSAEVFKHTRTSPGGPWVMGLNMTSARDGRFPGHVGIVVPLQLPDLRGFLLDLTAPQFTRPHKNIQLVPLLVPLDRDWFDESLPEAERRTAVGVHESVVTYQPVADHPGEVSFTNSPDWLWPTAGGRRQLYRTVAGSLIRECRHALAESLATA